MASEETKPKPEDYDGNVSQEQIDELETLRQRLLTAEQNGSADLEEARNAYQSFATHLLIDLSGKLEPGQDQDGSGEGNTSNTGQRDQFNVMKIYPDKPGGSFNTDWKLEEKRRNYASGKPSEDSVEYTCIADSVEKNSNVEATVYQKINGFKTKEADSISLKLTGPPHKDGAKSWVIPEFMTDGSAKKTLETENPHPKNKGINPKPLTKIGDSVVGKWFGYKGITWIKDDKRYVESWIHFPIKNIDDIGAEQTWKQYVPRTEISKDCTEARGKLTTSRLDGVKKGDPPDYKYASVREIEPPA